MPTPTIFLESGLQLESVLLALFLSGLLFFGFEIALGQWFPIGVPRQTRVPQEVLGVPPNFKLVPFYWCFTTQIVIYNQLGVPPIFFQYLRGAANQKRLINTALGGMAKSKINKILCWEILNSDPCLVIFNLPLFF